MIRHDTSFGAHATDLQAFETIGLSLAPTTPPPCPPPIPLPGRVTQDRHRQRVHRCREAVQDQRLGRDVLPPLGGDRGRMSVGLLFRGVFWF